MYVCIVVVYVLLCSVLYLLCVYSSSVCVCVYTCVCMYSVQQQQCMYTCMYVCMCMHSTQCMYVCVCTISPSLSLCVLSLSVCTTTTVCMYVYTMYYCIVVVYVLLRYVCMCTTTIVCMYVCTTILCVYAQYCSTLCVYIGSMCMQYTVCVCIVHSVYVYSMCVYVCIAHSVCVYVCMCCCCVRVSLALAACACVLPGCAYASTVSVYSVYGARDVASSRQWLPHSVQMCSESAVRQIEAAAVGTQQQSGVLCVQYIMLGQQLLAGLLAAVQQCMYVYVGMVCVSISWTVVQYWYCCCYDYLFIIIIYLFIVYSLLYVCLLALCAWARSRPLCRGWVSMRLQGAVFVGLQTLCVQSGTKMGGCISGKYFFRKRDFVFPGQNNPEILFRFRNTNFLSYPINLLKKFLYRISVWSDDLSNRARADKTKKHRN